MRTCLSRNAARLTCVLALLVLPVTAHAAQKIARTFEQLQPELEQNDKLTIFHRSGAKIVGRLVTLTESEVTVRTKEGERTFTQAEVDRIDCARSGPVWNGFAIGTAAVAVPMIIGAASTGGSENVPAMLAASALTGGGIGALVDALIIGDVKVYEAQPKAEKTFAVSPLLSSTRKGVLFSLRF